MNCRCISYNRPDLCPPNGRPEVVLPRPSWSAREQGIAVDVCIADAIKMLWRHGVITSGCCCGHNLIKPSVVVDIKEHAMFAAKLLQEHDGRDWDVMIWSLCTITAEGAIAALPANYYASFSPMRSSSAAAEKREPRGRGRKASAAAARTSAVK